MVTQIMGPSHALLALLAQTRAGVYRHAPGKIVFFLALFALAIAAGVLSPLSFVFFVSTFFVLHNFLDDIVLFNTTPTWRTQTLTAFAFIVFELINVDSTYNTGLLPGHIGPLAIGGVALCAGVMLGQSKTPQFPFLVYIAAHALGLLALAWLVPGGLAVENVFCFLVLCHYLNWYVYIYKKKRARTDRPQELRAYLRQAIGSNAFFVSLFMLCAWGVGFDGMAGGIAALVYFGVFQAIAFNVFTFMHLAMTLRPGDYVPRIRPLPMTAA